MNKLCPEIEITEKEQALAWKILFMGVRSAAKISLAVPIEQDIWLFLGR